MFELVYIMLGEGCNFNCKYCMQHPILTQPLPSKVSPNLISYLANMEQPRERKIKIIFFGGEPLLYFDAIKTIVNCLKYSNKFYYVIITNGSLLTDEMIEFINKNEIGVGVSNDGRKTFQFRDINVLENEQTFQKLNKLRSWGVSAVLNAQNFNIREDMFQYFADKGIDADRVNIDLILDTGLNNKYLVDFDFESFQKVMDSVEQSIFESLTTGEPRPEMSIANPLINRLREILGQDNESSRFDLLDVPKCGVGMRALNVDLEGNCYLCHNSSIKIGTIEDSYEQLVEKFLPYNLYAKSEKCQNCDVQLLCAGGCILVGNESREQYYCRLNQIYYGAFLNALKRINKYLINKEEC